MRTAIWTFILMALAAGPVRAEGSAAGTETEGGQQAAEAPHEGEPEAEASEPSVGEPASVARDATARPTTPDAQGECASLPVAVKRVGVRGSVWLQLADCKGTPVPAAAQALSALALPPKANTSTGDDGEHDGEPGDDLLPTINPELLVRLQRVAERYPGREIEIVSGYRTRGRAGSRHRSFDALDIRVEGVANEELVAFARTFEGTGVGYYPNSTFVHLDVRETTAYWVDESGPGQPARYAKKAEPAAGDAAVEPTVEATQGADAPPAATSAGADEPVAAAPTEPVGTEPATDEPVAAEPVAVEPVVEPVAAEPVAAEPAAVEPVALEPEGAEDATAAPTDVEPVAAEPITAEPVAAEPVAPEPVAVEPVTAAPVAAEPSAAEPAAADPAPATDPTATEPAAAKPAPATRSADSPQLASLAERALAVMNRVLRPKAAAGSGPGRRDY